MHMIDSNIFINFLRGKNPDMYKLLQKSDASFFKVPSVVKAELLVGAEKSINPARNRLQVEALLLPFEIIPFDDACVSHYAYIRSYLEKKGQSIGANDYLIAACVLAHGATLITDNVKEFKRIPGLTVEVWSEIAFS